MLLLSPCQSGEKEELYKGMKNMRIASIGKTVARIIQITTIIALAAIAIGCPPEPADPGSGNGNGNGGASGNIDSDSDGLIDINTIDELNNIRYNLEGSSYKTSDSDTGIATGCPTDGCSGYELMRSLNFENGAHYASGAVNNNWRPNAADSDNATNAGWVPIGNANPFAAIFEGNGNTITGLYTRGSGAIALFGETNSEAEIRNIGLIESASYGGDNDDSVGAFVGLNRGTITESYTTDGTANGGAGTDSVGALVGQNWGTITASYTTDGTANNDGQGFIGALVGFNVQGTITASYTNGGSANGSDSDLETVGGLVGSNWGGRIIESYASATANGGGGNDQVGALVGFHFSNGTNIATIIASYATGTANGGGGDDSVGALVGVALDNSVVTASYATGTANGGNDDDSVGALVGNNNGAIAASYATGTANGGPGSDAVGALVGNNNGAIAASYATGNANGDNDNDHIGALVGDNSGAITASYATGTANGGVDTDNGGALIGFNDTTTGMVAESYGFGAVMGHEFITQIGAPPTGVTAASGLTTANAGARWNAAESDTMDAWDFGSATQTPALRFADYDGAGADYDCDIFPATLPNDSAITCGITFIPGQGRPNPGGGNGGASGNIDSDSDGLIDISTIEELNNIRYNLEGTSYKTSDSDTGIATGCPTDGCSGYELMRSLNFDAGAHYASGAVNNNWRPDNTTPDKATNAGWAPIGNANPFAAIFEGNGNTITGLYTRGSGSIALFGATNSAAEIRNIGLIESASYGGDNDDSVGALVGVNAGSITESYTTDGTANGGAGTDSTGALVGLNTGSITASYTTNGTANGGAGTDSVGALVGQNWGTITASHTTDGTANNDGQGFIGTLVGFNVQGTITASYTNGGSANGSDSDLETVGGLVGSNWGGMIIESYASATANGGGGDDRVGALVGYHYNNENSIATIIASYATGTANGDGGNDNVGALVGVAHDNSVVTASYATGTANGGNDDDSVGALVGNNNGPIAASYATGDADGGGGNDDVGALVGNNGGAIVASYATGDADGGAGTDSVGVLVGNDTRTERTGMIAESYGFGMVMGQESTELLGAPPTGVTAASGLTAANAGSRWNAADDDTLNAWDFGDETQTPALRFADYDGAGADYDCDIFPATLPDDSAIICGTTFIPGQGRSNPGGGNGGAFGDIDSDSDGLIEINTIEDLNNIRYNLEGTSYKTSDSDTGIATGCPTDGCSGYELMRSLNFDTGAHYASGAVNNNWRPDNTTPDNATNAGWAPIGDASAPFAAIFEGNDNTITGLYTRGDMVVGLFGAISGDAAIRNVELTESDSYGGAGMDSVGNLVGSNNGSIIASSSIDGNANGGGGANAVGNLVGVNRGSITTSSSTDGIVNGGDFADVIGNLVGDNLGSITESFTVQGTANGISNSSGQADAIGNLVGRNSGSIIASFAENGQSNGNSSQSFIGNLVGFNFGGTITESHTVDGTVNGGNGNENIGGLTGLHLGGTIVASYAMNATVNGGDGGDIVGSLVGFNFQLEGTNVSNIIASYAVGGTASGGSASGVDQFDDVGALVGWNYGIITASYATGNANTISGDGGSIGALVGKNNGSIVASYATGNANGGDGNDNIGALVGDNNGSITASYATGTVSGGGGNDDIGALVGVKDADAVITASYGFGSFMDVRSVASAYGMPPAGVTDATDLTATNAGAEWNDVANDTMGAWDFGDATQTPALRYADYDGTENDYDCDDYPATLPDGSTLVCGTTIIPGQGR